MERWCALSRWADYMMFHSPFTERFIFGSVRSLRGKHWAVRVCCGPWIVIWTVVAFWVVMPWVAIVGLIGATVDAVNGEL